MHFVALTEIPPATPDALKAAAAVVDSSAYDLRLVLNAGLPAVVLVTDDVGRASRARAELEALGHRAVRCARADIVPSAQMVAIRVIDLDGGIARAEGQPERLPFDDVLCLLRAHHTATRETVEQVKERKLRPGMAVMTGGLVMTQTRKREVRSTAHDRQQVLYLFRRSGQTPFILREREVNYSGLGGSLAPSAFQNFTRTIDALRARCPNTAYDESLLKGRPIRGMSPGIEVTDVYAHLMAAAIAAR